MIRFDCRLKGRPTIIACIERTLAYMQSRPQIYTKDEMCRIYMRVIEQLYYEVRQFYELSIFEI